MLKRKTINRIKSMVKLAAILLMFLALGIDWEQLIF